jgi:hypothetical protein
LFFLIEIDHKNHIAIEQKFVSMLDASTGWVRFEEALPPFVVVVVVGALY